MGKEASSVSKRGSRAQGGLGDRSLQDNQRISKASNPDISDKRGVEKRASQKEKCFKYAAGTGSSFRGGCVQSAKSRHRALGTKGAERGYDGSKKVRPASNPLSAAAFRVNVG
jgi:hypothetical protein